MPKKTLKTRPVKRKKTTTSLSEKPKTKKKTPKKSATQKRAEHADRRGRVHAPIPDPKEKKKRDRIAANKSVKQSQFESVTIRDIYDIPPFTYYKPLDLNSINWERRLACKADPVLDLKTYFPNVFSLEFGPGHKKLIHEIETKIIEGGKKILACPRAWGKTAICRGMIMRAQKYGLRQFPFFIGSKEPKAVQTLDWIKGYWYRSTLLYEDFPEFAYPVYRIDGRGGMASSGQLYRDQRTHIEWKSDELQLPCMLFTEEDVQGYLKHDPDSVLYLEDHDRYLIKGSGCLVRVAGIDGSIRGEADLHPILLTQPRPDLILLDDIIKDAKADSPKSCEDLERLIESAIEYLSAPGVSQAVLWPGTVIREGDPTERYLDRQHKPEWAGERLSFITKYPKGIDNDLVHDEIDGVPNPQGELWLQYKEVRETSYRTYGNLKLANEFYRKHREQMDTGFEVVWEERYTKDSPNPDMNEISAIQSAMNLRFKDHLSFLSEVQNRPRSRVDTSGVLLTPDEVAEHVTNIPRNELSAQWNNICAFIDVQDEILFYAVFAFDHAYNGQFIDYGTFPDIKTRYFRKNQTMSWSLLTRNYYKEYPNERPQGNLNQNRSTKIRAPFEAKIYLALKQCVSWLLSRRFPKQDSHATELGIRALCIDTQWGKSAETVKRFVREFNDHRVMSYMGHPYLPSHNQLEEYKPTPGWLFEHEMHPNTKESKWVVKPYQAGGSYVLADVNRGKSFLMKRLAAPIGSQGCVTLFDAPPEQHRMFGDHVAGSEYPELILARGMRKDCWKERPERKGDNDYLDCATACMIVASICGASLKSTDQQPQQKRRSMREAYTNRNSKKRR